MKLKIALDEKKMDTRLLDKWLADGKVDQKEADKYFKNLPDESGNCLQKEVGPTTNKTAAQN